MTPSILLTGGSGLLALNWAIAVRDRSAVTLGLHERHVSLAGVTSRPFPLDSTDTIARGLDAIQPGLVVHSAGLTNIETCEAQPALAHHVNVELARHVAQACAARGLPLVHISTDHVVGGDRPLVDESQPTEPRNVYARTKADAEVRVLAAHPGALVVRTNFYGWGPTYRRSFSERILDALRAQEPITLFTDVYYTPILAEALVEAVHGLIERAASGILHVVGDDRISKHAFGLKLARQFGLDAGLIREGLLGDQPGLVPRPLDMSLSNAAARRLLGRTIGGVDAHLIRLAQLEQLGQAKELQTL